MQVWLVALVCESEWVVSVSIPNWIEQIADIWKISTA